uniref:Uncharacterized protein n=1 Tax=Arundo donax TaxID=35708 RepID=A0A0A8YWK1_ARUDO
MRFGHCWTWVFSIRF